MAGEWDKIQASYKKLQPQIKKYDQKQTEKLIKAIKDALEGAWDAEDAFKKAVKAARAGGIKGKKPEDFAADKGFKAAMATLEKEGKQHLSQVKVLKAFSVAAEPSHKELTKLLGEVKKHINKRDKAQIKFQSTLKEEHAQVKFAAQAMGKLTPAEMFYGARLDRVVDNVINKAKKSGASGPAGDAAKLIEQKERDKNLKASVKLAQQVAKLCDGALKKANTDPKAAAPYLKKAAELIKGLKAQNTAYQTVKKKNADLIKASKDKAKIVKVIATIAKAHDISASKYADALGKIRNLAA